MHFLVNCHWFWFKLQEELSGQHLWRSHERLDDFLSEVTSTDECNQCLGTPWKLYAELIESMDLLVNMNGRHDLAATTIEKSLAQCGPTWQSAGTLQINVTLQDWLWALTHTHIYIFIWIWFLGVSPWLIVLPVLGDVSLALCTTFGCFSLLGVWYELCGWDFSHILQILMSTNFPEIY